MHSVLFYVPQVSQMWGSKNVFARFTREIVPTTLKNIVPPLVKCMNKLSIQYIYPSYPEQKKILTFRCQTKMKIVPQLKCKNGLRNRGLI